MLAGNTSAFLGQAASVGAKTFWQRDMLLNLEMDQTYRLA